MAERRMTVEVDQEAVGKLVLDLCRVRQALAYFIDDPRFQVSVGGNPNVVEAMLARVHIVYDETNYKLNP